MKARIVKQKELLTLYRYIYIDICIERLFGNFWIMVNVVKLFILSKFNVTTCYNTKLWRLNSKPFYRRAICNQHQNHNPPDERSDSDNKYHPWSTLLR